jgi:hypothetical protein
MSRHADLRATRRKLTDRAVVSLRRAFKDAPGVSQRRLALAAADEFRVSVSTVIAALRGDTFHWVKA